MLAIITPVNLYRWAERYTLVSCQVEKLGFKPPLLDSKRNFCHHYLWINSEIFLGALRNCLRLDELQIQILHKSTFSKSSLFALTSLLNQWVPNNLQHIFCFYFISNLVTQMVNHLPAMQETWIWFLGQADPLKKTMATYSSILAWRIPLIEEPGGLQSLEVTKNRTGLCKEHFSFSPPSF